MTTEPKETSLSVLQEAALGEQRRPFPEHKGAMVDRELNLSISELYFGNAHAFWVKRCANLMSYPTLQKAISDEVVSPAIVELVEKMGRTTLSGPSFKGDAKYFDYAQWTYVIMKAVTGFLEGSLQASHLRDALSVYGKELSPRLIFDTPQALPIPEPPVPIDERLVMWEAIRTFCHGRIARFHARYLSGLCSYRAFYRCMHESRYPKIREKVFEVLSLLRVGAEPWDCYRHASRDLIAACNAFISQGTPENYTALNEVVKRHRWLITCDCGQRFERLEGMRSRR